MMFSTKYYLINNPDGIQEELVDIINNSEAKENVKILQKI